MLPHFKKWCNFRLNVCNKFIGTKGLIDKSLMIYQNKSVDKKLAFWELLLLSMKQRQIFFFFSCNSLLSLWSSECLQLISGSSAFSKPSLNVWKFLVHIMLKPSLVNFEDNLTSMGDEYSCLVVWTFFTTALLGNWELADISSVTFKSIISGF